MIIPIRTDYRMTRRPWVNYLLVAVNIAVFVLGYNGTMNHRPMAEAGLLQPDTPELYQFFTSMFMHGSWMHLIGNMLFLWVFGNAVNDRLGQAGYLAFYLAGGLLAGIGYLLLSGNAPVLGASGAISAVTGAYLVLLPRARVTLLVWLFYIILPLDVSSLYFLLFQLVWNVVMSLSQTITATPGAAEGGVAYIAHSSGYLFGIAVAAALLMGRFLPSNKLDMVSLFRNFWRREQYKRMVSGGYDPFTGARGSKHVSARHVDSTTPDMPQARELLLRREISQCLLASDLQGAAARYAELLKTEPQALLPRQQQLDLANYLMSTEQHQLAAMAYELFLMHYKDYQYAADIHLMLGLLYGRYLKEDELADKNLQKAISKLTDTRKLELARSELSALRQRKSQ